MVSVEVLFVFFIVLLFYFPENIVKQRNTLRLSPLCFLFPQTHFKMEKRDADVLYLLQTVSVCAFQTVPANPSAAGQKTNGDQIKKSFLNIIIILFRISNHSYHIYIGNNNNNI